MASKGVRRTLMTGSRPSFPYIHFVPPKEKWVIERIGKLNRIQESGICFIIPFFDKIAHVRGLQEDTINIEPQHVITEDNVQVDVDAVVYYRVLDTEKSCYNIVDPISAIANLAMSVMRKELGKKSFNQINQSRDDLNNTIQISLQELKEKWGIEVSRYEIQDVRPSKATALAMERVAEAERIKTANILISESERIKQENISIGEQTAEINRAKGKAEAMELIANATSKSIDVVAKAIGAPNGHEALTARIATEYISQLTGVLGTSKTVIVPANPLDINGIIKTALEISKV